MTTIPTHEPTEFTKGDSLSWKKSLSDYPAGDWTLNYYIRGAVTLDITATASGTDHLATISATDSDTLTAGSYWWQAVATKDSDRKTVGQGQFVVLPNVEDQVAGYDGRTHVKKTLDALEAVIEKRASLDQQSYSINNRSLSRMSVDELLKWRDKYRALYRSELKDEKIKNGIGVGGKVQVRFNS